MYLIRRLQLLCLHLPENVVGGAKRPNLGVTHLDVSRQTDEPQAVAVTEQALGPKLRDGRVLLGNLLCCFDLLGIKKTDPVNKTLSFRYTQNIRIS